MDNKAKMIPIKDSFDKLDVEIFTAEYMISPNEATMDAILDAGDIAGRSADKEFFGININIVNIQRQVPSIKYLAIRGSAEVVVKYAIGISKKNKKLKMYIMDNKRVRRNAE